MQEMVELSRSQAQTPDSAPLSVSFFIKTPGDPLLKKVVLSAGPAHFGREIKGDERVTIIGFTFAIFYILAFTVSILNLKKHPL